MRNPKAAFTTFLCILLTAAWLTGCSAPDIPAQTQGTEAATVPTVTDPVVTQPSSADPQPTDAIAAEEDIAQIPRQNVLQSGNPRTLSEWVFTNYEQTFSWRDQVGNFCSVSITLPAMAPVADFALDFNEAVYELGTAIVAETVECQETACSNFLLSVSYEAYLHDDILSILIIETTAVDYTVYTAYSFDLEDRQPLDVADLCDELLDMDYPSFILATNAISAHHFAAQYGGYIEELQDQYVSTDSYFETEPNSDVELYNELIAAIPYDTVNIGARNLFVGENGQIMLIYDAPSLAGSDSYPTIIPFDVRVTDWQRPSEAAAYGELFCLMDYVDGAYADAYCTILLRTFLADGEDFIEYAAKATSSRQDNIVSFLNYALLPEQIDRFHMECRGLLNDNDMTDAEIALVNRLLTLSGI